MSYDIYVIPSEACEDQARAQDYIDAQVGQPAQPEATALAAAISSHNLPLDDQRSFLSVHPLAAEGGMVTVPSPFPRAQDARDIAVAEALRAGHGLYDPQNGVVIDPRHAVDGSIESSTEGVFRLITPEVVTTLVDRLHDEDYLIVETSDQVYIQTQRRGGSYVVEHRDGSPERHFGIELATAEEVAQTMRLWIAGDRSAMLSAPWAPVDL